MPRFRARTSSDAAAAGDPQSLLGDVFRPCQFYISPQLPVTWRFAFDETIAWETYQGRLLDARQTRASRAFLSWSLLEESESGAAPRPIVSLKWDRERGEIHVVRGMLCHAWESYDAGGNVIESRETTKWVLELVGTLALADFTDGEELRDELICRLWQAVVGTSRLPLTSLEAPLPGFVLGRLAYVYRAAAEVPSPPAPLPQGARGECMRNWRELIEMGWRPELARSEQAKLLECVLRAVAPEQIAEAARRCIERWKELGPLPRDLVRLLKTVFNNVSLSPWTGFVANALAWVQTLVQLGEWFFVDEVDFLCWLLRQLSRHLTAYDLVTFHHRGANYPDALLLDAALKRLLQLAELEPALFELDTPPVDWPQWRPYAVTRLRRRALRHGMMLRRAYEGHAVPDAPTSPGENTRVLPAPFERVAEDQLQNPLRRRRQLFADDPIVALLTPRTRRLFLKSLHDLESFEHDELGRATFVDRPLGFGKEMLEPDQTPLVAHEAYSHAVARRRLDELATLARDVGIELPAFWPRLQQWLDEQRQFAGRTATLGYGSLGRPVASLADARRVSEDFAVVRTLPESWRRLQELFDWAMLLQRFDLYQFWQAHDYFVFLRRACGAERSVMEFGNPAGPVRILFESDPSSGYRSRGGVELPVAGLRIWEVRDDAGVVHDLRRENVYVLPRW